MTILIHNILENMDCWEGGCGSVGRSKEYSTETWGTEELHTPLPDSFPVGYWSCSVPGIASQSKLEIADGTATDYTTTAIPRMSLAGMVVPVEDTEQKPG